MDKDIVKNVLNRNNFEIIYEKRYKNCGYLLKEKSGTAVICFDKGTYVCYGKKEIKSVLEKALPSQMFNNRVFVVYGRDSESRSELQDLLKSWNLEPILIDELASQGRTIIEQLEKYISETNFGIVLLTPDDVGYLNGNEGCKKFRARQNVILELGMLLSKLGRSRVAILTKKNDDFERPSDINGMMYCEYKKEVKEISAKLARELKSNGYNIVA